MSRLRINPTNHKCENWLGLETAPILRDRGVCGGLAVIRCNACKMYFCQECWDDHLHMSIDNKSNKPIQPIADLARR